MALWRLLAVAAFALGVVGVFAGAAHGAVPAAVGLGGGQGLAGVRGLAAAPPALRPAGGPLARARRRRPRRQVAGHRDHGGQRRGAAAVRLGGPGVRIFVPLFLLGMGIWLWLRPEE
jgi:hypothetical protein